MSQWMHQFVQHEKQLILTHRIKFLTVTVILICLVYSSYQLDKMMTKEHWFSNMETSVEYSRHELITELSETAKDVLSLTSNDIFIDAIKIGNFSGLQSYFLNYSLLHLQYDQIRYINQEGIEKINVNRHLSQNAFASEFGQRDVSNDVFLKANDMPQGAVFVSRIINKTVMPVSKNHTLVRPEKTRHFLW